MVMTKEQRQQIVDEFISRHGRYDAALFFEEVKATGASHPAYGWFEWDESKAAYHYNIIQARMFAQHITIRIEQPKVVDDVMMKIVTEAPAFISPFSTRHSGGGLIKLDVEELCEEAAVTLRSWLRRYMVCLNHVGASSDAFEQVAQMLEEVGSSKAA